VSKLLGKQEVRGGAASDFAPLLQRQRALCGAAAQTIGGPRLQKSAPNNCPHCICLWTRCTDAPPSATPTQITLLTHQEASKMLRRALATLACVLGLAASAMAGKGAQAKGLYN